MKSPQYFWFCVIMFVVGIALLALGALGRERLKPRVAAMLILVGVLLAMVFMNLLLVQQMMNMNG